MTSLTCQCRTVLGRPRVGALAALLAAVVAFALSGPADATGWGGGGSSGTSESDRPITIDPVPRFDEAEVRALVDKPSIVTFTVDTPRIAKGGSAKLTWRVENADSVSISTIGSVSRSGSRTVQPQAKTTYVLTARNNNGTVTKAVTVDITNLVIIGTVHKIETTPGTVTLHENVAYDFVAKSNTARWASSKPLTFGGYGGAKGWARKMNSVRAEDNKDYQNVLQVEPEHKPNGFVYGEYSVPIPPNARFMATVGLTKGHGSADGATVTIQVRGPAIGRRKQPWKSVAVKTIKHDGRLDTITADLKPWANKTVTIRLVVTAGRNYQDDMVVWIAPRIVK